ncbi:MAG: FecR domain-containing protein, partial [Chitinophagaceae bacterium]|nr:FecR domain-containing protein [Chitinophagaceae bacterium]
MNIHEARTFVARFVQGDYTQEEHESFREWERTAPMDHIEAIIDELELQQKKVNLAGKPSIQWVNQLESRIDSLETGKLVPFTRRKKLNAVIGWAAAVVVLLGAGLYFMLNKGAVNEPAKQVAKETGAEILPGTDMAVLTLADGRMVQLNDATDGLLAEEGGTSIKQNKDGLLVYEQHTNNKSNTEVYNTISTPKGGQYQVVLPDQTKIWLNAGSSIRFPVAFTGKERRVAITGEVYFEVAKNPSMPFKAVIATELTAGGLAKGRGEVEVVGTHFNIMAYPNEPSIQTTLLKGSVKVVSDKLSKVLKPGQQARIIDYPVASDELTVQDIPNAENLVAWKDGFFPSGSADVMMRQIARWYNVDLQYEGKVPDMN